MDLRRNILSLTLPALPTRMEHRAGTIELGSLENGTAAAVMNLVSRILATDPEPLSVHLRWDAEQFDWASPEAITFARTLSKSLPLASMFLADAQLSQRLFVSALPELQIRTSRGEPFIVYSFSQDAFESCLQDLAGRIERSLHPHVRDCVLERLRADIVLNSPAD